ncbi:MAG: hypothetical protein GYA24_07785 [Candidatus Lokiarchaeota archaeon]|nr:hypothetical protein [Candidatus Lokiarchaeota archaeon]
MMSTDPDEKAKFKFTLTPPPPPPPSIEQITRGMQPAGASTATSTPLPPPPALPGARQGMAPLTPPPEPPVLQPIQQAYYTPDQMAEALQLKQALVQARQLIEMKDCELANFNTAFKEIQVQLAQVGDVIKAKDAEIEGLRSSAELIAAEMRNKDNAAFRAKAKIEVLEESVSRSKQEAIAYMKKAEDLQKENLKLGEDLRALAAEKSDLQAKMDEARKTAQAQVEAIQAEIETIRAEKLQINERLMKRIAEVEEQEKIMLGLRDEIATLKRRLGEEIETKRSLETKPAESTTRIITGRDAIIQLFNKLLDNALHNVMIVVPSIKDLQELDLMKLKPSVKVLVSVKVDMKSQEELNYVMELGKLNKLDIRSFDNEDRFGINVDRGIVFIGVNSKTQPFGLLTEDPQAIDLFVKQFLIETWTLGRPVNAHR